MGGFGLMLDCPWRGKRCFGAMVFAVRGGSRCRCSDRWACRWTGGGSRRYGRALGREDAASARRDSIAMARARRENAVVAEHVKPRRWDQCGELLEQLEALGYVE